MVQFAEALMVQVQLTKRSNHRVSLEKYGWGPKRPHVSSVHASVLKGSKDEDFIEEEFFANSSISDDLQPTSDGLQANKDVLLSTCFLYLDGCRHLATLL